LENSSQMQNLKLIM